MKPLWRILILFILSMSCHKAYLYVHLENRTGDSIDVYIDSLYLMTMQPMSFERCKVFHLLPTNTYIKSRHIEETLLNYYIDSIGVNNEVFFHKYEIEGRKEDSLVAKLVFERKDLTPPKETWVYFIDDSIYYKLKGTGTEYE